MTGQSEVSGAKVSGAKVSGYKANSEHYKKREFHDPEMAKTEPQDYSSIVRNAKYKQRIINEQRREYAESTAFNAYGSVVKKDPLVEARCNPSLKWSTDRATDGKPACADIDTPNAIKSKLMQYAANAKIIGSKSGQSYVTTTNVCQPYVDAPYSLDAVAEVPTLKQLSALPPCSNQTEYAFIDKETIILPKFSGVKQAWTDGVIANAKSSLSSGASSGALYDALSGAVNIASSKILAPFGLKDRVVTVDIPFTDKSLDVLAPNAASNMLNELGYLAYNAVDPTRLAVSGFETLASHHLPPPAQKVAKYVTQGAMLAAAAYAAPTLAAVPTVLAMKVAGNNASAFVRATISDASQVVSAGYNKYAWGGVDDDIKPEEYSVSVDEKGLKGGLKHRNTQCDEEKLTQMKRRLKTRREVLFAKEATEIEMDQFWQTKKPIDGVTQDESDVDSIDVSTIDVNEVNDVNAYEDQKAYYMKELTSKFKAGYTTESTPLSEKSTAGQLGKVESGNQGKSFMQKIFSSGECAGSALNRHTSKKAKKYALYRL